MLNRFEPLLKIVCLALAVLLLFQIVHRATHLDPLGHASIPPLPALAVPAQPTNAPANPSLKQQAPGSNTTGLTASSTKGTNAVAQAKPPRHGRNPSPQVDPQFAGQFGPQFGGPPAALNVPTPIQTRVNRIKESEVLGPVMRPMPMALMGIADNDVFLRAPNGQTGMIKEGGELGGIKLLRIGINRVLVEEDGKKKELTLFEGFGSESLLPKETDTPTNAIVTPKQKENP